MIPYLNTTVDGIKNLTLFLGGIPTPVDETHPAFQEIWENLATIEPTKVRELLDSGKRVRRLLASFGNVTVDGDTVYYKGEAVHGLLATRMITMLEDGQDIRPWALFLENLQQNPAKHAVDELYGWLEHANMPITERGNFLAYKKVANDYTSYHNNPDGTAFRNDIGTFVSMPRNKVDDNRNRTCSSGLHFCSWDYLGSYMGYTGKVVILEINPAHVVSIPTDYNNAKGRAEGYLIVGEIPQEQCKHAFPGLSYVGYDDSEYITYRQEGEIDYSDIEDGWYDEYADPDELDEKCAEAYQMGSKEGYNDGHADDWFDPCIHRDYFDTEEEYSDYNDGYSDGYTEGQAVMEDEWEEEEDEILTEDDGILFAGTIDEFLKGMMYISENQLEDSEALKAAKLAELNMIPQSRVDDWSLDSIIDDIDSRRMTVAEFIQNYNPSESVTFYVLQEIGRNR